MGGGVGKGKGEAVRRTLEPGEPADGGGDAAAQVVLLEVERHQVAQVAQLPRERPLEPLLPKVQDGDGAPADVARHAAPRARLWPVP